MKWILSVTKVCRELSEKGFWMDTVGMEALVWMFVNE